MTLTAQVTPVVKPKTYSGEELKAELLRRGIPLTIFQALHEGGPYAATSTKSTE